MSTIATQFVRCIDDSPTLAGEPMYITKGRVYQIVTEDNHPYDGIVKVLDPDREEDVRLVNLDRVFKARQEDWEPFNKAFERVDAQLNARSRTPIRYHKDRFTSIDTDWS